MRRPFLDRPFPILGHSLPTGALLLVASVLIGSLVLALIHRTGIGVLGALPLTPMFVLHGQVWRLFTWSMFELDAQGLLFGALMLAFLGRDLSSIWGARRYLLVCAGMALGTGVLTTLLGLVWKDVYFTQYLTVWPLVNALLVAWSLMFGNRTILFMFVLPISGRNLLYLTIGLNVIFAVMGSFAGAAPNFLAMAVMYAYLRSRTIWETRSRLKELLSQKRGSRGLKVIDGGWNRDSKGGNGSGWVH